MNFCDTYNNRRLFCSGWEFFKAPFGSEYSDGFDFRAVDLPHDWLIYNTNNLYETSTGWYRKSFSYEKKPGVRTYIRFDGVYMDSHVYINGKTAGEWKYGYSAFQFDITDLVVNGENTITVRVDHSAPNSRWYSAQEFTAACGCANLPKCASETMACTFPRKRTARIGQ